MMIRAIFIILSVIAIYMAIMDNRQPERTIGWLLIFFVSLPIGLVLFMFLGINWKRKKLKDEHSKEINTLIQAFLEEVEEKSYKGLMNLFAKNSESPVFSQNEVEFFFNGDEKFEALKRELRRAEHHIHMEYYIYQNDVIGNEIKDILIDKAKEGIQVRFIIDKMGSIKLNRSFIKELRDNGVKVVSYSYFLAPLFRLINTQINYRNHRKIVVIDGKVGFTGGMNIGDEYAGRGPLGYWRDAHLMIKGSCVLGLQGIFLDDYMTIQKANNIYPFFDVEFENYFPITENKGNTIMQVVKSGPESPYSSIMQGALKMISMAKTSINIVTPYFVPTESIIDALKIAALSGVKIRILFPGEYDHLTVYHASKTYLSQISEYGVEVYLFKKKSFVHSKIMTVDGNVCSVGTANMDRRSYELNYEVNCVIYDKEKTKEVDDMIESDILESTHVGTEELKGDKFFHKLYGRGCRLLSALL